jgi:uncharacterized membrane protein
MTAIKINNPSISGKGLALFGGFAFAVMYFAALWAARTDSTQPLKVALSVAATAAFLLFLIAELRLVRELDELEQRIQLEALAVAFPLSVALVMLLGLLQRFWPLPVEDASYRHIWPVMIFFYVIGLALARRRYR